MNAVTGLDLHARLASDPRDFVTAGFLFFALVLLAAVVLLVVRHLVWRGADRVGVPLVVGVNSGVALLLWLTTHLDLEVAVALALSLIALATAPRLLRNLTASGRLLIVSNVLFVLFGLLAFAWSIATIPVSPLTRGLLWATYALLVLAAPTTLLQTFERWEVLCRAGWSRPHLPLPPTPRAHYPKVSFHVACYAEPPELVIATLDALARLRYPNFEVLVIDNNTPDPALWQPVEARCKALGRRFRFFHLHRWVGAKSGALNFALRQTAPDAELIALVDSDYQVAPHFLEVVIGHFDDPQRGFVQAPHHHREWAHSRYLRMCNWENEVRQLVFSSINERDAAVLMGTMCVIRRAVLESVGGWSEWCVTEDSELAIRIHAAGYSSIYLTTPLGHGLLPETFDGYKKQRFRWAYGPTQELKQHIRLYLPWPFGHASALSVKQRLHHANHNIGAMNNGGGYPVTLLNCAIIASMLTHGEVVQAPLLVALALLVPLLAQFVLRCLVSHVVLRCSLRDTLGGALASMALTHTTNMAGLWALCTGSIPWRRTSKFKALPMGLQAMTAARTELLLGLAMVLFGAGAAVKSHATGLLLLLLIGLVLQGLRCLAAPALTLLAEWDLRSPRVVVPIPLPANPVAEAGQRDQDLATHRSTSEA